MAVANEMAQLAFDNNEVPIGCVIVCNNKIIAKGYNTRENNNDVLGHAEINAIKSATKKLETWKLSNCEMYVSSEPCLMCYGVILQSRIKTVFIGSYQDEVKKSSYKYYLEDVGIVSDKFVNEESKTIIQSFFEFLRKEEND